MPKRLCPFAESHRPQLKNHIGIKEVNMGVMMKENMKHVYEKTLTMMYQASQSNGNKENSTPTALDISTRGCGPKILAGQRKLNFSGQLDGYYTQEQVLQAADQNHFIPIACAFCKNIPSVPKTCQYCERCLCEFCSRDCIGCHHTFCSNCATVRYEAKTEKFICFGCL